MPGQRLRFTWGFRRLFQSRFGKAGAECGISRIPEQKILQAMHPDVCTCTRLCVPPTTQAGESTNVILTGKSCTPAGRKIVLQCGDSR